MASSWSKLAGDYAIAALHGAKRQIQRRFPEVLLMGDAERPEVALSFDDGPHPRDTPALLAVLARHGATATFSWLGERAEARPDLVREAAAAGHQLMIHGYRHRSFLLERTDALASMLARTQLLLATHSGRDPAAITGVRPPFGHLSGPLLRSLRAWGYKPVLGSIMPIHWLQPARLSVRQVLAQTLGGDLIVLHESLGGPPVAELTDTILAGLRERGLALVSVDALRTPPAAPHPAQPL